jgi:phage tail-like protein
MNPTLGLALHFEVTIDDFDLGAWSKCEGLTVKFDVIDHANAEDDYVHRMPGATSYENIKLTRGVTQVSNSVSVWLSAQRRAPTKGTGAITLMDAARNAVMVWELFGVLPVRWAGPTLDVGASQVAMETLELAHEGFLI